MAESKLDDPAVLESWHKPAFAAWNGPELPQSTPSFHSSSSYHSCSSSSFATASITNTYLRSFTTLAVGLYAPDLAIRLEDVDLLVITPHPRRRYCLFWATHLGNLPFRTISI